MGEEKVCDRFYFYDLNVKNCQSCESLCNEYDLHKRICYDYCKDYLSEKLRSNNDQETSVYTMVILIFVFGGIILILIFICSFLLVKRFKAKKFKSKTTFTSLNPTTEVGLSPIGDKNCELYNFQTDEELANNVVSESSLTHKLSPDILDSNVDHSFLNNEESLNLKTSLPFL